MNHLNQDSLTQAVIERLAHTPNPRLKEILSSLVTHLHAFARDVHLTEEEWFQGIEFLTATGQKCTSTRQEFILLSDVLGLSMLTVSMQNDKPQGCTESTVFGPFHVPNAPQYENGADIANGASGQPCHVHGFIRGKSGEAIANATIDVWQADDEGHYDVQKEGLDHAQARGVLHSRTDGSYDFKSIVAEAYPIPTDGPVGHMLEATRRSAWRPAHLHFMIQAPGYQTLITHVFRRGDKYLEADPVFGVRQSLIADWVRQSDGLTDLAFDFVLNPVV
ncbi:intradiol ring-cleavage dioxygenase [Hydrogenophaga taeniospiralis]|jgi:hydroxyquinol 1,2-dioxygenase|uniref:intradiol ring-cleavage dioxygenase n=1 Tax=Hydrogenophaga taeniospiralis TaxID=65656 RepID=UPI001CFA6632|nr:intradiol ring-cleavage dioxygenase [Hydrogenophaga taeniospiralis]MCB4363334.1 intradiol ring-cleavage dioxygenase [Hydrogenophaga taeniospiralis]